MPEAAQPALKLQLSSPIEELALTKIFDPLEPTADGSVATFLDVDTSVATLTVEAKDADIDLGSSSTLDIGEWTTTTSIKETEARVEIYASGADATAAEEKENETENAAPPPTPVCICVFKVKYQPSTKDQREELYDQLNSASLQKRKAVETMRESALIVSRHAPPSKPKNKSAAVQGGFLNKGKKQKQPESKLMELYNKYLGPASFARHTFPVAKNYVIFFGVATFLHFKGQLFAVPAPV